MNDLENVFRQLRVQAMEKRFSNMNPQQRQAVFQVKGPLLILAGAGSGKTTVVINRIAGMIKFGDACHSEYLPEMPLEQAADLLRAYIGGAAVSDDALSGAMGSYPVRPWNILAITFTNKAAAELRERLEKMLGEEARDITASTFHSCCARILRRDIDKLGYSRSFAIYDTDDSVRVIKDVMSELKTDDKMFKPKSVLAEIGHAKDSMQSPDEYELLCGNDFRKQQIAKIYRLYQQRLLSASALDFDDMICKTVELFEKFPEVLEYYQNRWRYMMVDEYQDTNHAQYRLVSLLAEKYHNICVVGDDDQSIYRFRGATIENILSFENQFPGTRVIRLEQNYRSTQTILDAANGVIRHNEGRKGKNLWTENGKGEQIHLKKVQDERAEARFIAETIENNVASGMKYSDHAVLYRMNAQSGVIEQHFIKAGIPYRLFGGAKFFDRKEIRDMVAYLNILINPGDVIRLKRIINEPKRGIGDATVAAVEQIASENGIPMFEVLRHADNYAALARKSAPLMRFVEMIEGFRETALHEGLDILLDEIISKTGYEVMLRAQGEEGLTRMENIGELKSTMIKYEEQNPEGTLEGFLEEIALYTDLDDMDREEDAVLLMTMHSSKGLEFPVVFLPGLEDGIFPSIRCINDTAEMEEERRLCYVAITRAKQKLYLSHAAERMVFGSTNHNRLSRFIDEIPCETLDPSDDTAARYAARKAVRKTPVFVKDTVLAGAPQHHKSVEVSFSTGSRVRHRVFGEGTVLSIQPMGSDHLVEVAFDKVGTKKIMANFAKLEKI